MNPVSKFAAAKSGRCMRKAKNGMVVWIPSTRYSMRARSMRAMASGRVAAWQMSLDSIGS